MLIDNENAGAKRKAARLRMLPATPATGWLPPREFPNLDNAALIGIDCETFDPDLSAAGPGWARGRGHIVGVSLAAVTHRGERGKWYFPVRHEVEPEYNLDAKNVFDYLRYTLQSNTPKVGANLQYDLGWLCEENILTNGMLFDVQYAESLLSESGRVGLEELGEKYLGKGKSSSLLYEWCALAYGGKATPAQRANIYRTSPRLAGLYAEDDADMPLDILHKQYPIIEAEGLQEVFRMECDLIRLLVRMRQRGVRVDLDRTEQIYTELRGETATIQAEIKRQIGFEVNPDAGASLAKAFDYLGIAYPQTAQGNPSFTKAVLDSIDHPIAQMIRDVREREKICNTFLRNYILLKNVNGRVHCQFHPLRGDADGTRSGRFSSSDPNLQNIPTRSKLGKKVRSAFVKDIGHFAWEKVDYSQIEYRCLAHFAVGPGSDALRDKYNNDPTTDYHTVTQALVKQIANQEIARPYIKNINFGLLYGMGEPLLAKTLGIPLHEARPLFNAYHTGNPYVAATMKAASDEVNRNGFITTIMGRRSRFELWESIDGKGYPVSFELACEYYGQRIRVSHTHKAINRRLQGSAADIIKKAMVALDKSGVFDVLGVPLLQVHDELDNSIPDDSPITREATAFMHRTMETVLPLRVPVKVDAGRGPHWGDIE
jgi:DNA polymerase I-like protein with 3'-5' exonuclease and polymerase domains